jgi:hypothetical protein
MCLPILASMIHLWVTIRGISFPITSALSTGVGKLVQPPMDSSVL